MDNINWDEFYEQATHDHFKDLAGSDFYFAYDLDDDLGGYFSIVPKKFYDANRCMLDQHIQDAIAHLVPCGHNGFVEDTESVFSFDGDDVDGQRLLVKAGFVQNQSLI